MRKKSIINNRMRHALYVEVKNVGNGYLLECRAKLSSIVPTPENMQGMDLTSLDTIQRGQKRFLMIAYRDTDESGLSMNDNEPIKLAIASSGGLFGGFTTLPPAKKPDSILLTVEVKPLGFEPTRKDFRLWVGDNRKLYLGEV